jgi:short-subunit dehydrogenase
VSAASLAERLAERMAAGRHGVLALLSSVAGERGRADNYVYGAAKAALTAYASGLGHRLRGTGVTVVTVKPGPVDTPMTAGRGYPPGLVADVDRVGLRIHQALERGERVVYVPGGWRWIMAVIRALPVGLFERIRVGPR